MSYWQNQMMAEKLREEIAAEMQQIRLEEEALAARRPRREPRPDWYSRRMFSLGSWMVTTGHDLRRRYELRDCSSDYPTALSHSR